MPVSSAQTRYIDKNMLDLEIDRFAQLDKPSLIFRIVVLFEAMVFSQKVKKDSKVVIKQCVDKNSGSS